MSLTHIATQSMPTVSWRPVSKGDLELGADAVGARDQHRRAHLARAVKSDERAEAADSVQHMGAQRRPARRRNSGTSRCLRSISTPAAL